MQKKSKEPVTGQLLTVLQVAQHCQVCDRTVYRQIKQLNVPTVRIGRQIRIRPEHVPLFLKKEW